MNNEVTLSKPLPYETNPVNSVSNKYPFYIEL